MKKLSVAFLLIVGTLQVQAQQQDSSHKPPVYAIVLDSAQRESLFAVIRSADMKPSDIRNVIEFLVQKSQLMTPVATLGTIPLTTPRNGANEAKKGGKKAL